MRLAYLISQYPAISHTFILRELIALRKIGFEIPVASINKADRADKALSATERQEKKDTFYVKSAGIYRILACLFSIMITSPIRAWDTLCWSWQLSRGGVKQNMKQTAYFIEACVVSFWLKKQACRHLHIHFGNAAAMVGMLASKLNQSSYSLTIHGSTIFTQVDSQQLKEKLNQASFVLCISYFCKSQCMSLLPFSSWKKLCLARSIGLDPSTYLHRPLPKLKDTFKLIFIGRLEPKKGAFLAIQAIESLANHPEIMLTIIGKGPEERSLKHYVKTKELESRIHFKGMLNFEAVQNEYANSHCLVVPSFQEGVPTVIQEAMAMGLPCIASRVMGIMELIEENKSGLLFTPSHLGELTAAIITLKTKKRTYKILSEAGKKRVFELYNSQKNSAILASIFKEKLAR